MNDGPAIPRRDTKWWGWGDAETRKPLGKASLELLSELIGKTSHQPPPELKDVSLPSAESLPGAIAEVVGPEFVLTDHEDRLRHSGGQSYADLMRRRLGAFDAAPDAIVLPADAAQVARLLEVCAEHGIAVVPFGGGTSVVGGVDPVRGSFARLISLDLSRLRDVTVDARSLTATLGAGLRGPEAEAKLGAAGLTLGHFPQSFEYATIGGFAATRSAGQSSSGYGRFDEMVSSIEVLTPVGPLRTLETPHTAAGPSLRQLIVGSEGTLGVIPEVTVRVRPAPKHRVFEAWMTESFEAGAEIVRSLAQSEALPTVLRVSDETETQVNLGLAGIAGGARRALDSYLKLRRRSGGSLVITGYEGEREEVSRRRQIASRMLRAGGAASLGKAPGKAWEHGRYDGPYLRDELMDSGIFVETLETSHIWSRYDELYQAVRTAIADAMTDQGSPGLVMCHLSHAYADGASLYFTFMSRKREGGELKQWAAVKTAACEAIVAHGGTITHHHAVGRDHAPYMAAEVGELGLESLRALKGRLDPAGVMNPGKLLP